MMCVWMTESLLCVYCFNNVYAEKQSFEIVSEKVEPLFNIKGHWGQVGLYLNDRYFWGNVYVHCSARVVSSI